MLEEKNEVINDEEVEDLTDVETFEEFDEFEEEEKQEEENKGEKKAKPKNPKKGRTRFAQRLSENIKKHSKHILTPGGNLKLVPINYEFAYELTELFCETIVELMLEGYTVWFDQFGKYEIKTQAPKKMSNYFTNYKEVILPELKLIRFYPSPTLKARIRGDIKGKIKRTQGIASEEFQAKVRQRKLEREAAKRGN